MSVKKIKMIKNLIISLRNFFLKITYLDRNLDLIKINQGIIFCGSKRDLYSSKLQDYEFKVFSQWGEDGIIQHLTNNISIANKTFIEFGVEDFSESNCRFLMMKDYWSGYVIDGSRANINRLKNTYYYWKYKLESVSEFITKENINEILVRSGFDKNVGILSIDLDGNDYFILEALSQWTADIIIVEFNAAFGSKQKLTIPYDPQFVRSRSHYSNIYYGASLLAFSSLLSERGYGLVGINSVGSNAFFVKRELLNDRVMECSVEDCFHEAIFRESRDIDGQLIFQPASELMCVINDMPLLDLDSMEIITVSQILD